MSIKNIVYEVVKLANIYNNPSTGIKFVNYNSTEYLSVPCIFKVPSSKTNVNLMNYTIVTTITQSPKKKTVTAIEEPTTE